MVFFFIPGHVHRAGVVAVMVVVVVVVGKRCRKVNFFKCCCMLH
jgi:hypothetical protein